MIPQFPEFKKLELSDKDEIESFTKQFPPYSDFNFVSIWSWDVEEDVRVSWLNGNLVVRFNDYLTRTPFLSFIGNKEINDTVEKLIHVSVILGMQPVLKLIPEISVEGLNTDKFVINEDRDNFDYVYDARALASLTAKNLIKKRQQANHFSQQYPDAEIKIIDISNKVNQKNILGLFQKWVDNKLKEEKLSTFQSEEFNVVKRLFLLVKKVDLLCVGVYINNNLSAFFLNEINKSSYSLGLIAKADTSLPGIYAFLRQKNAEIVASFNNKYLNDEQDLGIKNLRDAKMQFRPVSFLKKYTLSLKKDEPVHN